MREIKFRVWYFNNWCTINLNEGLTEIGYSCYMDCVKNGDKFYQYTGLKDANGVEIYEGDIVKSDECKKTGFVYYSAGSFRVKYNDEEETLDQPSLLYQPDGGVSDLIKIGDIHENFELLEEL